MFAAPKISGWDLYEQMMRQSTILRTGCNSLDTLLGGGLYSGEWTELVGPVSSGKTQLCLYVAMNVAWRTNGTVIYIDTGNNFSATRLLQMYKATKQQFADEKEKKEKMADVLNKLRVFQVHDIFSLLNVLDQIKSMIANKDSDFVSRGSLLIIDSLGSLISSVISKNSLGHYLMVDISRQIKNILLNSQMAALTTNFTVRGGDEKEKFKPNQLKPALGEAWSHMANTQLFLHNHNLESDNLNTISDESTNYFWGELLASSHNVTGSKFYFKVSTEGIQETAPPVNMMLDDDT
jgi:RAD51-like protein 3